MSKLMLIDATHAEETRVAVVADGQIEDFDFEARDKRQLRGNIYLAKVTRVEPSLQAAFVDYGGNRHGFLAFSEIHPDYYQIPKEDREALIAEAEEEEGGRSKRRGRGRTRPAAAAVEGAPEDGAEAIEDDAEAEAVEDEDEDEEEDDEDEGDSESKTRRQAAIFQRKYRIQEVIRRRQVILIQVVKEERGNKGAAVTTYLSLAGRYCVLMPNTGRGGGISRKITNAADRKRLKKITGEFEVPRGAGLIVRTAGAKRTKTEIKRDFEYLSKLWQNIVSKTMESHAPCLIHEEGHLVLRAVRDLYDKDVEQIIVEGEEAYTEAKNFVSMLMPSHARKVVNYEDPTPLFVASGAEAQLESIFSPIVQLPSGGYIVINQAEALVAIDVNSGKATRERNVEATALKTNLEAASEACRQMRLRDLAGLIVIDFIDMEDMKNNRAVEKRMKDSLRIDRARVQTGRISQFGLFEISRQRRRAGVLELSSEPCPHCGGAGRVRAIESAALQLLRTIEARAADDRVDEIHVDAPPEVALYILNEKRTTIADVEEVCHVSVRIEAQQGLKAGEYEIEATHDGEAVVYKPIKPIDFAKVRPLPPPLPDELEEDEVDEDDLIDTRSGREDDEDDDADDVVSDEGGDSEDEEASASNDDDDNRRGKRGRRGGRRRRGGRERDSESDSLDVIEPHDDLRPAPRDSGRDGQREDGGRGRSRRRGRGRDRDRTGDRPRIPDIAADGGEMLDAIASAPFLLPAIEPEPEVAEPVANHVEIAAAPPIPVDEPSPAPEFVTDALAMAEAPPIPEAVLESALSAAEAEPVPAVQPVEASVHVPVQPHPEPTAEPAPEPVRHPLHGEITEVKPSDTPRKAGWWSKKKAG
jgi:ribonuclease E